jgi:hypothetical protein
MPQINDFNIFVTQWGKVILELVVADLVKKLIAFMESEDTFFLKARHWTISRAT